MLYIHCTYMFFHFRITLKSHWHLHLHVSRCQQYIYRTFAFTVRWQYICIHAIHIQEKTLPVRASIHPPTHPSIHLLTFHWHYIYIAFTLQLHHIYITFTIQSHVMRTYSSFTLHSQIIYITLILYLHLLLDLHLHLYWIAITCTFTFT